MNRTMPLIFFNLPVSTIIASELFSKGLIFLVESLLFLILMDFLTADRFILELIFLNSLNLLLAAIFKLHLKKNLISALGKTTEPQSLPSIIGLVVFAANCL